MDDARIELEARERRDSDVEVEPLQSEVDDYESSAAEYEISTYPADFTLEVLWSKWKAEDIIVPQFQRQFVWKHVQASKLIESFLAGLPVPAIFLYVERKSQKYLVIDGQQRLRSIFYFFEEIEKAIKEMIIAQDRDRCSDDFQTFIKSCLNTIFRSIKSSEIAGLLNKFGTARKQRFRELMDERAETAYNNIVENRHNTAHGSGSNLTFQEAVASYRMGLSVIESLSAALQE